VKVLTVQLQPVSLGVVTIALRLTADGVAMEITAADRERLDAVAPPGGMVSPFYQADFGPHPHRV
jgi:hypothetical protein